MILENSFIVVVVVCQEYNIDISEQCYWVALVEIY